MSTRGYWAVTLDSPTGWGLGQSSRRTYRLHNLTKEEAIVRACEWYTQDYGSPIQLELVAVEEWEPTTEQERLDALEMDALNAHEGIKRYPGHGIEE